MTRPSLAQVLGAILETEPLEAACARLGCSRAELVEILRPYSSVARAAPQRANPTEPDGLFAPPAAVQQRLAEAPTAESRAAEPVQTVETRATLYSDGASRGNPGPAGAGAVLVFAGGRQVRLGRYLGVQTNNVAEYQGVIIGMERALELGVQELSIKADSMLAMMQLRGEWKLKNEGLRPLFEKARLLAARFRSVSYAHIPREQNAAADEMSNRAIDERL